jgi:hypothetical protein
MITIWLGTSGWNIARYWSGELVSSRPSLLLREHPVFRGEQHPECRDLFGFWPDGTRMDVSEFSEYKDIVEQRARTPEEVARHNWASDVREKVASCEETQWMPIAKTNAIRKERIRLTVFAILPPFLFLTGVGLMNRATGNISMVAARLTATIGALSIAIVIALSISQITLSIAGLSSTPTSECGQSLLWPCSP